jgi:hypothetical protein
VQEKDPHSATSYQMGLFEPPFNLAGSLLKQLLGFLNALFLPEREYISNEIPHASTDDRTSDGNGRSRK